MRDISALVEFSLDIGISLEEIWGSCLRIICDSRSAQDCPEGTS
jgi:hypothetical protein